MTSFERRGKKQRKTSIEEIQELVEMRNHKLIEYTPGEKNPTTIPQQSFLTIQCLSCDFIWKTKVHVYKNRVATSAGCRNCFEKNIKNPEIYPNSPFLPKGPSLEQGKRTIEALREIHISGPFGSIQNREQLFMYLANTPNAYNTFVQKILENNKEQESRENNWDGALFSKHHVLPLHAAGSPDEWNLVLLTKEEHWQAHKLRYEVYQERADLAATYLTLWNAQNVSSSESLAEDEIEEVPVVNVDTKYFYRRTPETLQAIQNGMIWEHKEGYVVIIEPNAVQTIQEIKTKLCEALPPGHKDAERMQSNRTSVNFLREHIQTVFADPTLPSIRRCRASAYNFRVSSLP